MKKKLIILMLLLVILSINVSAFRFNFFGREVVIFEPTTTVTSIIKTNEKFERINVDDIIPIVEKKINLKYFEGENFCINTDERNIYISIQDAKIVKINRPTGCYNVYVKEKIVSELFEIYKEKGDLWYDDVKGKASVPLKLKMKIIWLKLI